MERKKQTKSKLPSKKISKTEEQLKNVLSQYETDEKPFNPKLFSALLEEFLGTYILIGYTGKGEPVNITSAKTQQDMDALNTNLQRFLTMFIGGRGLDTSMGEEHDSTEDE